MDYEWFGDTPCFIKNDEMAQYTLMKHETYEIEEQYSLG